MLKIDVHGKNEPNAVLMGAGENKRKDRSEILILQEPISFSSASIEFAALVNKEACFDSNETRITFLCQLFMLH
jgi:hypothetical protein